MLCLCIQQCTFVPRAIPRSSRPRSVWAGDPVLSALWCFTGIPGGVWITMHLPKQRVPPILLDSFSKICLQNSYL